MSRKHGILGQHPAKQRCKGHRNMYPGAQVSRLELPAGGSDRCLGTRARLTVGDLQLQGAARCQQESEVKCRTRAVPLAKHNRTPAARQGSNFDPRRQREFRTQQLRVMPRRRRPRVPRRPKHHAFSVRERIFELR